MLQIDRTARAPISAPPERCLALLADVEDYPRWSSLIRAAERKAENRIAIRAELLGVSFEMDCTLEVRRPREAILRRMPHHAGDDERFDAAWTVEPGEITLHVTAAIDAPGPARLIRGRVEKRLTDDLLADFIRAL